MVKVIVPLRIESVSAQLRWPNDPGVVERALRDDIGAPIERRAFFVDGAAKLLHKVQGRVIENRMDGIETKRIDVVVGNPFEGVGDKEVANLVAVSVIKVEGRSPRSLVAACKVRPKLRQVASFRPHMVV